MTHPRNWATVCKKTASAFPKSSHPRSANIAPAMSFFLRLCRHCRWRRVGAPLTILLSMVVILFLTNTLAEFSKYRPSTGSFVTFHRHVFRPRRRCGCLYLRRRRLLAFAASSVVVISGGWAHSTLQLFLGINIPCSFSALSSRHRRSSGRAWHQPVNHLGSHLLLFRAHPVACRRRHHARRSIIVPSAGAAAAAGKYFRRPQRHRRRLSARDLSFHWLGKIPPPWRRKPQTHAATCPRALIIGRSRSASLTCSWPMQRKLPSITTRRPSATPPSPSSTPSKASAAGLLLIAYIAGVTSIFSCLIGLTNSPSADSLQLQPRRPAARRFLVKIHPQAQNPARGDVDLHPCRLRHRDCFRLRLLNRPGHLVRRHQHIGHDPIIVTYLVTNLGLPIYMLKISQSGFQPAETSDHPGPRDRADVVSALWSG